MLNGTPILPANEVHANDQVQNSLDGITSDLGAVGRVLVCVRGDAQSEELARYTRNLADRLGASWMATPLPGKRSSRCKTPELERINAVLRLVEALGGKAVRIPLSGRVADNLISFANKNNVAHIVLAKSEHERWYEYSVVRDLMHRAGRIRLHLINEHSPLIGHVKPIVTPAGESWIATLAPYLWAGIAVAAAVMLAKGIGTLVGTSRIAHVEVVLLTSNCRCRRQVRAGRVAFGHRTGVFLLRFFLLATALQPGYRRSVRRDGFFAVLNRWRHRVKLGGEVARSNSRQHRSSARH